MQNAKLECHLAGLHVLSHEVFEREKFCNNFYSTIFLQNIYIYFFTHSLNWIIIMVMCVQFITIVSLHTYSHLKVRLIFHPKKKGKIFFFCFKIMKQKINAKELQVREKQIICVVFTYLILWNKSMSNSLTAFHSLIVQH